MELRFVPTEQDWRTVYNTWPRSSGWTVFQFIMSFVPLFLLGGVLANLGFSVAGWLCLGLSIAIAFASYEVPRLHHARRFRSSLFLNGERVLTVNNDGITAIVPYARTQFQWGAFASYRETKQSFVLFTSQGQVASWIPKRVMTALQIEELCGLLRQKLTRI